LETVVGKKGRPEDLREAASAVAAERFHLPEAILCGHVSLGHDEVVKRRGTKVGDAVAVTLDGDGGRQAGDGDCAIELGQCVAQGLPGPMTGIKESGGGEDKKKHRKDDDEAEKDALALGL
jgi:hypothetical protein